MSEGVTYIMGEYANNQQAYAGEKGFNMAAGIIDTFDIMESTSMETREGEKIRMALQAMTLDLSQMFIDLGEYKMPSNQTLNNFSNHLTIYNNATEDFLNALISH